MISGFLDVGDFPLVLLDFTWLCKKKTLKKSCLGFLVQPMRKQIKTNWFLGCSHWFDQKSKKYICFFLFCWQLHVKSKKEHVFLFCWQNQLKSKKYNQKSQNIVATPRVTIWIAWVFSGFWGFLGFPNDLFLRILYDFVLKKKLIVF